MAVVAVVRVVNLVRSVVVVGPGIGMSGVFEGAVVVGAASGKANGRSISKATHRQLVNWSLVIDTLYHWTIDLRW